MDKKLNSGLPSLVLNATNKEHQYDLTKFIKDSYKAESRDVDLLPGVQGKGYVLLIIPMDEETPTLRLLRPQDMAVERLLRSFAVPVLYRLDLEKARSKNPSKEKKRFSKLIKNLSKSDEGLQLVLTDSQAFDIVSDWVPKKVPLTSFSIMMSNYMSSGNLDLLMKSIKAVDKLKTGDKILVVEACNHNRKCNDIGTVQIPKLLEERVGEELDFEFSFGRPFPEDLSNYRLIVHCGACMIDRQKYLRRLLKAKEAGVPVTNYGMLLSYLRGEDVLERAVQPFLSP
jgi:[FeFe] hydrogenase H-cluster maturation GTPase HydF